MKGRGDEGRVGVSYGGWWCWILATCWFASAAHACALPTHLPHLPAHLPAPARFCPACRRQEAKERPPEEPAAAEEEEQKEAEGEEAGEVRRGGNPRQGVVRCVRGAWGSVGAASP